MVRVMGIVPLKRVKDAWEKLYDGKIDKNKLRGRMKNAGKILILSNLDVDGTRDL